MKQTNHVPADRGEAEGLSALVAAHEWSATPLGHRQSWPPSLKSAVRLVLASPVSMCLLCGRDGIMIYNDAYAKMAGQRHPASLGRSVLDAWPELYDFHADVLSRGLGGEALSFVQKELELRRNGLRERVWMDLDFSPVTDEAGQVVAILSVAFDVTTQMLAERALRESEERLGLALQAAGTVGTWDWDVPSDVIVADRRFADMFGVDPELAAQGAPISAYIGGIHPDDRERVSGDIDAALRAGGEYRSEYRLGGDGEEPRWVLAVGRVMVGQDGMAERLPGIVTDITDHKRAIEEAASSEARFRTLADAMPQMVWSTLPDGFHDYYNARWYEFTGVPENSTDGEGWNDMFHPDDQKRARALWHHSLETGEPYQIEYRLRHHSGQYRWTLGRALPIRDQQGNIVRWIGTCTDIHEAKQHAQEREIIAQELSHRIKNIFSVLSGIIALSTRTYPETREFSEQLRRRLLALGRAHDFVRPHSSASVGSFSRGSLHGLIRELLAAYEDAGVVIAGADAPIDDGAATPLALIFHELATNAAKYGAFARPGGKLRIEGERVGDHHVVRWIESGTGAGPNGDAPAGFGSRLIELSVKGQLGGEYERIWHDDGLEIELKLPLASLNRAARLWQAGQE